MKKRNIILIAIVVVIGVIAAVVALRGSRKSTYSLDYYVSEPATITRIYIADKRDNEVLLERRPDSTWTVNNSYVASQPLVDMLLSTLNTMRIRQPVNKNAIPGTIKDLSAHGIKVEVYQRVYSIDWFGHRLRLFPHEKLTVTYFVGRETQDLLGSYMWRQGDKVPYIVHIPGLRGFITPRFITEPISWRSHSIVDLNVQQIERVELRIPAQPNEDFAIVRNGDGFDFELLATHQRVPYFDTARVAQMLSGFTNLNFDEYATIVPHSHADSCVSVTPRTILRITDTAGTTRELRTFIKYTNPDDLKAISDPSTYEVFDINRLYAILDDQDTVLIQYFVFDNILQPASYFLGHDKTIIAR